MNFDCPYCGQNLDADDDLSGTALNCPSCKNEIIVPNQHPNRAGGGMKMCPFCSEPIKAAAVKCKHCGSMLVGGSSPSMRRVPEPPRPMPNNRGERPGIKINLWVILVLALIVGLICGYKVYNQQSNPGPYVEVNNGRLYYIAPATKAEATALGEHLTPNVFNGDEKLIELSYTNGEYHILAPVRPGFEDNVELRQELAVMALTASAEIFNNKTVKMDLCDQQYTVFASVSCLDGASLVVDATAPANQSSQGNSVAYDKGYAYGQRMAKQDQSFGTYKQASADTSLNDQFFWGAKSAGYSMGTSDYGEFVSGYEQGYAMTR